MIRLVVTDLDGTFWDEDLTVPEPHRQAVAALRDRGVEVMVATSRRHRVVAEHLGRAGLDVAAVVLDGAMGVHLGTGIRFHDARFPAPAAHRVLEAFRRHGMEPCAYVDEADIDVVLPPEPASCPAHVEYLRPIARTGNLDEVVSAGGVYGFSVLGRDRPDLSPVASTIARTGAETTLFPEDRFETAYLQVEPEHGKRREGIGIVVRETSASWLPPGHLVFALVAEFKKRKGLWLPAQNPF
ncbi:MAG TPA: HAD hydrolase family protein [Microthrixaceae bacterium]|nr:HAD hydrolase family protein [Microthrixaceae bacterium]